MWSDRVNSKTLFDSPFICDARDIDQQLSYVSKRTFCRKGAKERPLSPPGVGN
jgi:hypothetical protein